MGTDQLSRGWRGAGGRDYVHRLQGWQPPSSAGSGAPHPTIGSPPGATVARPGDTTPSPPTPNCPPSRRMPTTGHTPAPSWPSETWKAHAGLSHCPSGNFYANAAWLSCAVLAHNIYRWIQSHTRPVGQTLTNGNTVRTRLFRLPAKDREPRTETDPAPPHQMAMGRPLPHHPHQHPQAAPTLLTRLAQHNEPPNHRPQGSTRPHTLQTQPHTPKQTGRTPTEPSSGKSKAPIRSQPPCRGNTAPRPETGRQITEKAPSQIQAESGPPRPGGHLQV